MSADLRAAAQRVIEWLDAPGDGALSDSDLEALRAALAAAPAPAPVAQPLTQDAISEMLADTREVFDASGAETPQVVRDVIEYVASWLQVYQDKAAAGIGAQEQP